MCGRDAAPAAAAAAMRWGTKGEVARRVGRNEWRERGGPWAGRGCGARGAAHPPCAARRLVSGAGDIKLTKDGNVLLQEMVSCFWP